VKIAAFVISLGAIAIAAYSLMLSIRRERREEELFRRHKQALPEPHFTKSTKSSEGKKINVYEITNVGAVAARRVGLWWADGLGGRVSEVVWLQKGALMPGQSESLAIEYPVEVASVMQSTYWKELLSSFARPLAPLPARHPQLRTAWTDDSGKHNTPPPMTTHPTGQRPKSLRPAGRTRPRSRKPPARGT
jgi:hypothetical protein